MGCGVRGWPSASAAALAISILPLGVGKVPLGPEVEGFRRAPDPALFLELIPGDAAIHGLEGLVDHLLIGAVQERLVEAHGGGQAAEDFLVGQAFAHGFGAFDLRAHGELEVRA